MKEALLAWAALAHDSAQLGQQQTAALKPLLKGARSPPAPSWPRGWAPSTLRHRAADTLQLFRAAQTKHFLFPPSLFAVHSIKLQAGNEFICQMYFVLTQHPGYLLGIKFHIGVEPFVFPSVNKLQMLISVQQQQRLRQHNRQACQNIYWISCKSETKRLCISNWTPSRTPQLNFRSAPLFTQNPIWYKYITSDICMLKSTTE